MTGGVLHTGDGRSSNKEIPGIVGAATGYFISEMSGALDCLDYCNKIKVQS